MDIREKLMRQHVPYEVWMLQATEEAIVAGQLDRIAVNAFIESFAVHARGLIAFFNGEDGTDASHFTDPAYRSFVRGPVPKALIRKINQQIAHITEKRVTDSGKKLNGKDIVELRRRIEEELSEFLAHLTPHYRGHWNAKGLPISEARG